MKIKKIQIIFFTLFIIVYAFLNINFCFAFDLNTIYPNLPLAPKITSESKLPAYILYFFAFGIYVAGMIAVASIAWGGIQFIMSAQDPSKVGEAKDRIKGAFIGLFLLFGAVVILQTINPQLKNLGLTIEIEEPRGLQLHGSAGTIGAPNQVEDLSKYSGKYNILTWPEYVKDINGNSVYNCDKNIAFYMVYRYSQKNFGGWNENFAKLHCGNSITLSGEMSYYALPQTPGIYFYHNLDCSPSKEDKSKNYPQSPTTSPQPKLEHGNIINGAFDGNIRCVRVINGPDKNGPFYGVTLFRGYNYSSGSVGGWAWIADKGLKNGYYEVKVNEGLGSSTLTDNWADWLSAAVYQKAAWNPDGSVMTGGQGITLYSGRSKEEGGDGRYCPPNHPKVCTITGEDVGINFRFGQLSKMKTTYLAGKTPPEEIASCPYLDSRNETSKRKDCFQSMDIGGNFLVILSNYDPSKPLTFVQHYITYAQAFPNAGNPDGPPSIETTDIGSKDYAQYITIIPLAKEFKPGKYGD